MYANATYFYANSYFFKYSILFWRSKTNKKASYMPANAHTAQTKIPRVGLAGVLAWSVSNYTVAFSNKSDK